MSNAKNGQVASRVASATTKTPTERMSDFASALRRRWPAALLVFALTLGTAAVLTETRHKQYAATAQILLQPTDAVQAAISPGSVSSPADAQRDVNTYAKMITVAPVAEAVRQQLGLKMTVPELTGGIGVSGEETSNLVSITAQNSSPARAAQLATAFATRYQAYRRQTAVQQISQALAAAQRDPRARIHGSAVALRVAQLQAAAASQTGGVQIVKPAGVPGSPASPNVRTDLAVGLIAALILAAATVLGLEAVDRRLLGGPQFEAAFGAPVLAVIPGGGRARDAARLRATRRQAYTDLAARLTFTSVAEDSRAIMISPASERESAGAVALGLAEALSVLGRRVVVVEADLGGQQTLSGVEPEEAGGLASVLIGHSTFEQEVTDVHLVDGSTARRRELEPWVLISYSTLSSGQPVAQPEALLGRAEMRNVVEQAKAYGDLVLVLSAPLDHPGGVLPLAPLCDGVIVLADERSTKLDQAQGIVELLSSAGRSLLGTVLVAGGSAAQGWPGDGQGFAGAFPRPMEESVNGSGRGSHPHAAAASQDD